MEIVEKHRYQSVYCWLPEPGTKRFYGLVLNRLRADQSTFTTPTWMPGQEADAEAYIRRFYGEDALRVETEEALQCIRQERIKEQANAV